MGELEVTLTMTPEEFAFDNGTINEGAIGVAKTKLRDCYNQILELLDEYVDMSIENRKVIAMWILGTYFHKQFTTFPILFLNAMRGSGKTRTLKLISHLQYMGDGTIQNNISEAVLFRTAKVRGIILDEIESLGNKEKGTLRELLNASYKKGAKVQRLKKVESKGTTEQVIEDFSLYTPVAMANIWGIEEVLADRCITLVLEKSGRPEITKIIEDFDNDERILDIKRTLIKIQCSLCSVVMQKKYIYGWNNYIKDKYKSTLLHYTTETTLNYITTQDTHLDSLKLNEIFNKIDSYDINGRNLEIIFPLVILASYLEEGEFENVLKVLAELTKSRKEDEMTNDKDVSLYSFIAKMEGYRFEWIEMKVLTKMFREFLGDEQTEEQWLNDRWLGRALKRLKLVAQKRRLSKGMEVMLDVDKAIDKAKLFKTTEEVKT